MNDDLVWAIKNGDLDKVKEIIEGKGSDVNATIDEEGILKGRTNTEYLFLLAAIWEGHTSCVKFLIEKGSSKSGCAPDGTSYLNAAEKDEIKYARNRLQGHQKSAQGRSKEEFGISAMAVSRGFNVVWKSLVLGGVPPHGARLCG
ncbi:unnamed protein product [Lepeophtheirus salmonis]|uniref:(salmon louse) hypothetical protein n=1 Tax=Lepeophtheirus salmonis TaxID=72036 RepID=A0A7R8D7S6_LEPSM|nr:unnamed protein product [Lepeophtheirus salmonis]CAF3028268.1 unnamed protein product [Lepeophtheirus salmonis]